MMPGGRPTKYTDEFCDKVIELGREGASKHEMAWALGIHYDTFNEWQKEKPEFSDAVKRSTVIAQGWWEHKGRMATIGGIEGFNATAFIFNMKNRFKNDWKDKHEVDNTSSDGSMTPTVVERVIVKATDKDS